MLVNWDGLFSNKEYYLKTTIIDCRLVTIISLIRINCNAFLSFAEEMIRQLILGKLFVNIQIFTILAFNQNIHKNGSLSEDVNTCSNNLKSILSFTGLLRAGSVVYLLCTTYIIWWWNVIKYQIQFSYEKLNILKHFVNYKLVNKTKFKKVYFEDLLGAIISEL